MTSQLLINEPPLQLLPSLATAIGLNEAIVLQQIQYWINSNQQRKSKHHFINGRWWTYNTAEAWQEQFPFWSVSTVRRILASLRDSGLVIAEAHGDNGFDHTLWYTIDYSALNDLPNLAKSNYPSFDNTDLANLGKSTNTETSITERSQEKETSPPVESKPTPPHIANMQAAQEIYPAPIQALIQAIKDITLNTNTARIAEAAYTLFGFDATPEELKRLFLGKDSWFMKDGPGAWGNSSRPNVGNVTSSILIAREWEKQRTSPTQVAETFALIQAIQAKQLQNGAMRAEVQALPVDVRKHLEAATSGNWSRINTLTSEQWQAATPKG
jgi:hypothetical protein